MENTFVWNRFKCIYCSSDVALSDTFCSNCGSTIPSSEEEYIITYYFRKSYPYAVIIQFLLKHHNWKMSLRTLKTWLRCYGLKRKSIMTQNLSARMDQAISEELQGPSSNSGYRTMWSRLNLFHGLPIPCDAVMVKLQEKDPEGCSRRR